MCAVQVVLHREDSRCSADDADRSITAAPEEWTLIAEDRSPEDRWDRLDAVM